MLVFFCLCLNPRGKRRYIQALMCVPVCFLVYAINHADLPLTAQLPFFLIMDVIIALLLFKGAVWDRISCGCIGMMVSSAANILMILIVTVISDTSVYQASVLPSYPGLFRLLVQIVYLITCGAIYWYMFRSRKAFIGLPRREAILLNISFLVCILQSTLAQHAGMDPNLMEHYSFFVTYLLVSSSCFVFFIIWLQLTLRLHTRKHLLEMEQQQLACERARLADMQSSYLALRTWRHDFHNHISIMNYYVEQEESDALREYLRELNQQMPILPMAVHTENMVFNALINTKMLLATQSGADFQVEAELPESLPLDDVTFCALLGNLLDNAVEATKRLPPESKPWIRVSAHLSDGNFVLRVANSADGAYRFLCNRLLSRKNEPNHGIGLTRIRQIVHLLNGTLKLTPEQDTFEALVHIPLPCEKEVGLCMSAD